MTRLILARSLVQASCLLTALVLAGCGSGPPSVESSDEEATVTGKLTFKGKPVTNGEIAFDPSNYLRKDAAPRRAPLGEDGSYTIKTLVGMNHVLFSIKETAKDPMLQDVSLEFDVKPGENQFDVELPPPGMTPPSGG